ALRVLVIALFALTLYQPTLLSDRFQLGGDQPVAAVFVIDTSPSMGYAVNDRTRLADATQRATGLLDELPAGSRVAVIDSADPTAMWEPSVADARRAIEALKDSRGGGPPVTTGLATAYQLLRKVDEEVGEESGPLPRLVVVFTDRTAASWDAARNDDLVRLRDGVPKPAPAHLVADVGADQPVDVAVLSAEVRPQVVPRDQPVTVAATVQATGTDVPAAVVKCRLDNTGPVERKEITLKAGTPQAVGFPFRDLKPGFHQAEVTLETADRLPTSGVRTVTFRVGEARRILTIAGDPDDAVFWQIAHRSRGEFDCDVKTPAEVRDFAGYEAVCVLGVADPAARTADGKPLWDALAVYANRGGKLLVVPGAAEAENYPPAVLPGRFVKVLDAPAAFPSGVAWAVDEKAERHPLIAPFRDWKLRGTVDFLKNPRRAWKYWDVEAPPENVAVFYDDAAEPAKRHPAVLTRTLKGGGTVAMLTTRMDTPWEPSQRWHNYWDTAESSWAVVFPNLLMRYLAGDTSEANFNFPTGQTVAVPLPKLAAGKPPKLVLEGPGVGGDDAFPKVGENQTELRLPPGKTLTAGNFVLRTEDGAWREAFSLNPPADE
ncbi:MAG: vWA domain-containing protein, partial [Fimbriiglobus sp.]